MGYETELDRQRQRDIVAWLQFNNALPGVEIVELPQHHNMDFAMLGERLGPTPAVLHLLAIDEPFGVIQSELEVKWLTDLRWKQPGCRGVFISLDKLLWSLNVATGGIPCELAVRFNGGTVAIAPIDRWDSQTGVVWVKRRDRPRGKEHVLVPWDEFRVVGNMPEPAKVDADDDFAF